MNTKIIHKMYLDPILFDFAILVLEKFSIDYDFSRSRDDRCSKILRRAFLDMIVLDFSVFENSRSRSRLDFFNARHITIGQMNFQSECTGNESSADLFAHMFCIQEVLIFSYEYPHSYVVHLC